MDKIKNSNWKIKSICVLLLYLYVIRNIVSKVFPIYNDIDEVLALIGAMLIAFNFLKSMTIKKSFSLIIIGLLLFISSGLIGDLIYKYQPILKVSLPDIFLSVKFFFWVSLGYYIFKNVENVDDCFFTLGKHAKKIIIVLFALTIFDMVFHVFNQYNDVKLGLRSVGLYEGPSSLASTAVTLLCVTLLGSKSKALNKETLMCLFIILSTLRFKSFAAVAVFVLLFMMKRVTRSRITWWKIALLGIVAVVVANQQIIMYINASQGSARVQLYFKSFSIFKDYFPIGTGFGTYASYYSGIDYSPVYGLYHLSNIYGLGQGYLGFLNDTFWPMVIGQTGFIGLLGYCISLLWIYKEIKIGIYINRQYYYVGMYIFLYLLILSSSESAYLHWNSFFMAIIIGILICHFNKRRRNLPSSLQ